MGDLLIDECTSSFDPLGFKLPLTRFLSLLSMSPASFKSSSSSQSPRCCWPPRPARSLDYIVNLKSLFPTLTSLLQPGLFRRGRWEYIQKKDTYGWLVEWFWARVARTDSLCCVINRVRVNHPFSYILQARPIPNPSLALCLSCIFLLLPSL